MARVVVCGGTLAAMTSLYPLLKQVHIGCVVASGLGFLLRGLWMLADSPLLRSSPTRILPHIVDTILLLSAIALAYASGQYPIAQDWLTAKVAGLVAYILLGTVALRGPSMRVRALAWVAALAVFGYIVSVALLRHPAGVLSLS